MVATLGHEDSNGETLTKRLVRWEGKAGRPRAENS